MNVLSRLEGHWVVLEAELVEINKDISYCETCIQKYGYITIVHSPDCDLHFMRFYCVQGVFHISSTAPEGIYDYCVFGNPSYFRCMFAFFLAALVNAHCTGVEKK